MTIFDSGLLFGHPLSTCTTAITDAIDVAFYVRSKNIWSNSSRQLTSSVLAFCFYRSHCRLHSFG